MNNRIVISNIHEYRRLIIDGDLVLTRIDPFIGEDTLFQQNLRGSYLIMCKINNISVDIHKYKKLLIHLYSAIDRELILQHSILNISQEIRYDKGFHYYNEMALSLQCSDATKTLKEIINIVKVRNYNIELKIKLVNGEIVRFIV